MNGLDVWRDERWEARRSLVGFYAKQSFLDPMGCFFCKQPASMVFFGDGVSDYVNAYHGRSSEWASFYISTEYPTRI